MAVFFAAALIVFIGMTGLAVDYGFAALERRVLQNAVDAAAVTGATNLSRAVSPIPDVQTIATRNNIALTTTVACEYIDNSNAVTGPCSGTPSGTTSGVKVTATNDRATYFMRVLGTPQVTVSANSMARVFAWTQTSAATQNASNTLFLVCGRQTMLVGNPRAYLDILDATQPNGVNPNAVNRWFVIHGPQVADCDIRDSDFKGLNSTTGSITLPSDYMYTESGNRAGPVSQAIQTPGGCAAGLSTDDAALDNCKMYIPIFTQAFEKTNGDWRVRAVMWLPFLVVRAGANTHHAMLLENMPLMTTADTLLAPWTRNTRTAFTAVRTVQ